tara:strand:+ start:8583 stop:8948 length:366 start_codon:yes stop_codon:yes gene_type:complete
MDIIKNVLDKTSSLRKQYEKRSDVRGYLNEYEGIFSVPSEADCYRISLGYLERFLLMANHKNVGDNLEQGMLKIERWDESCGFFSDEYTILNGTKKLKSGLFEWSGSGNIENTWQSFSKFE